MKGKITVYYKDRGFGFIQPDPEDERTFPSDLPEWLRGEPEVVFFHITKSEIPEEEIESGLRVQFDQYRNKTGHLTARWIRKEK